MSLQTWKIKLKSHYLSAIFLIAFVIASLYLPLDNENIIEKQEISRNEARKSHKKQRIARKKDHVPTTCDLFSGRWIFDNISYPLYEERQCSFMRNSFACEKYGRKDLEYQRWRWQPHDCDLPRFNSTTLLEKIRGKKLVFVGDSLNKNQFISMLCLIEPSLNQASPKLVVREGNFYIFQATEYNATIGFYWSPFLVESNCDDPEHHLVKDRTIKITAIEEHARQWTDADILVFDSYSWWTAPYMTLLWGSFGSSDAIYKRVDTRLRPYEMGLNTWSDWLEININQTKTKMFFMSLSPSHFLRESLDYEQSCYNETEPIFKEGYWGIATNRKMMHVVESTIRKLEKRGIKLEYLNITHLSDYRKDAHPSIYRRFPYKISEKQRANPKSYSDCLHWCLPGVPDIWNQILYSYIIKST